ncbi:MAG: thioredoxin [Firmicutes bacterium]|nr:thioredoxin [Bacillota bacterium]
MALKHANEQNFNEMVNGNGLVLVDFFATWCGPCKMLGPVLEDMASDRDSIDIVKVDIDESMNLARNYGIMSVPTLLLFKDGQVVAQTNGFQPKESLQRFIDENK